MFYLLMGTCKLNDINPFIWFKNVLERIATHPINRINVLLLYNGSPLKNHDDPWYFTGGLLFKIGMKACYYEENFNRTAIIRNKQKEATTAVKLSKHIIMDPLLSSNANKSKIDITKFITETFEKTVSSSRSRIIIFCIILFLQFGAYEMASYLLGHHYTSSFNDLQQKSANDAIIGLVVGLIKYLLLLILLIKSPAEHTRRRRLAKYIVLLGSLYLWTVLDLFTTYFNYDSQKQELAEQSFKENSVPIYGKVVFASFMRDVSYHKRVIEVAEKLSVQTSGYIVIVQLDDSIYTYSRLKTVCHYFNYYAHDYYDSTFLTNIQKKVPDLPNCQQFMFEFTLPLKRIPDLPAVDKYVKIMYDPIKNGIAMSTDSATGVTPTFDSIPSVTRQQRND